MWHTLKEKLSFKLIVLTGSIYTTQYLGIAFIMGATVAILRQDGVSLDKLALLNLAALPLAGKVFYAPLVDGFRPLFQGQYRSWLLIAQAIMALSLLAIGMLDYTHQLMLILVVLIIYGFAVALQDVAIDGLACKIFTKDQRHYANGLQFSGNLLGNIIGGGVILIAYPWLGWRGSLFALAALTGLSWLQILFYQEPCNSTLTKSNQDFKSLIQECKIFIGENKRWFLLLMIFPFGMSGPFSTLNPLLVDAGWGLGDIGFALKVYGSLVGVASALIASLLIEKFGRKRILFNLTIALAIALAAMLPVTNGHHSVFFVYLSITAYFCVFPALLTVFATMIMDRASNSDRHATFFTLQFSLIALMGFAYAGLSMVVAKHFGFSAVVLASIMCLCCCAFLVSRIKKINIL